MTDEPQHKHRKYWLLSIFAVFIAILGVILPEVDINPIIYINATSITQVGLSSVSGNLSDLNDINGLSWGGIESTNPFTITINFTNITHFNYVELKAIYYSATDTPSTHIVDFEIWCSEERDWVDLFDLSNHAEWQYFTRNIPDHIHFVDPSGNVSVRLNHTANGNVNHRINITAARLIIN